MLDVAGPLVKPGGRLVFAVCSLIDREGRGQAEAFLARHPGWQARPLEGAGRAYGPGTLLLPGRDSTERFFFAVLEKPC